ncbi:Dimer Tnp hAT domain-containing protein [Aphis craccivora]|uniref:Dimer Tnp hAT domain-containing protein n=1 Tax=Aphis craccivora TaxID=307492 RepID=A0A6G0ZQ36_APHCR|nr:Dimer Tnp hAT domain-containing protein [Aphis craccivora]
MLMLQILQKSKFFNKYERRVQFLRLKWQLSYFITEHLSPLNKNIKTIYFSNICHSKARRLIKHLKEYCIPAVLNMGYSYPPRVGLPYVIRPDFVCSNLITLTLKTIFNFDEEIFVLPGSNAAVERVYSLMNSTWTNSRNKLDIKTVEVTLIIKTWFNNKSREVHGEKSQGVHE